MPTTVKTGWLKDNNGDKFAPKTLTSQVQTSDGVLLEDKIQSDLSTKINVSDIADNLITNNSSKVLSAAQGVVISDITDGLQNQISDLNENKINTSDIADNLTTNSSSKVLSASQGNALYNLIKGVQSDVSTLDSEFDGHDHTADQITDVEWMATASSADGTEILPERTISFTSNYAMIMLVPTYKLVEGNKYIVYWNGVSYTCTAVLSSSGDMLLGNAKYHKSTMTNTGEPFCFTEANGSGNVYKSTTTTEDVTARIVEIVRVPNKLPDEFLPDSLTTQLTEMQIQIDSVENKTVFYVTLTNEMGGYTSDATYDQIKTAYEAGNGINCKVVNAHDNGATHNFCLPLTKLSTDSFIFEGVYQTTLEVKGVRVIIDSTSRNVEFYTIYNFDLVQSIVDTAVAQKTQVQFITWEADD